MTPFVRLAWFAAACFVIIFGIGEFVGWLIESYEGPSWWGTDLRLITEAGTRFLDGDGIYADPRYLNTPLAALVGGVLAKVDFLVLSITYAAIKLGIVGLSVRAVVDRSPGAASALIAVTLVATLPFLHDVMLGNTNALLVGAMVPAVLLSPARRSGMILGIVVAVFAKPLIVPVMLWLLVWRRPVFIGATFAGAVTTLVGLLLTGPAAYVAWIRALVGGTRFASPFAGNHGVTAIAPDMWLPIAGIVTIGLFFVLARRGEQAGLTWAAACGVLLAPYAGTYSALPITLALPGMVRLAPRMAWLVVALSPIATTHPLPMYAGAILLGGAMYLERRQ